MPTVLVRLTVKAAIIALCLAAGTAAAADVPAPHPTTRAKSANAPTANDEASYSLGLAFATEWKEGGLTEGLSEAAVVRGIHDALAGKPLGPEDRKRASDFLGNAYARLAAGNKKAAEDFLAKNAHAPGVKTTASGLQYVVMSPGDAGPGPGPNDRIAVNYRGTLLDGKEFDSSYSRGKPATVRLNSVIAGWREALPLMAPHSKWKLFVPPDLAYGATPPPAIPANSLLVFEVELLGIEPAGAGGAP